MPPTSSLTRALLPLALLAACGEEELHRGLAVRDANEMVAVLHRQGIVAKREHLGGTYSLKVPREDFARALGALSAAGLPREDYRTLAQVFPGEGLLVTPFEQRARLMFALNQEIARTLTGIDGVVGARVHVVMPELDLRGAPSAKTTAAVVIHHRPEVDPGELLVKVRQMVANSAQGLAYKDVSVAFFKAPPREALGVPAAPAAAPAGAGGGGGQAGGGQGAPAVGWRALGTQALAAVLILAGFGLGARRLLARPAAPRRLPRPDGA